MKLEKQILFTTTLNLSPALIKYFPAPTARSGSGTQHKQQCSPSPTNQCQSMSGIHDAFLHSQQLTNSLPPPPPTTHFKPQSTTTFNIRSFPQTLAVCYLSAKIHILGKSMNARNYIFSQSSFQRSYCHQKLVYAVHWTCWDFFPACLPSLL